MTKYYDNTGRRVPSPRGESVPSAPVVLLLALGFALGLLAAVVYVYVYTPAQTSTTAPVTYAGSVGTMDDGGNVQIYSWTDPKTNREYLVPVYGDAVGGMCERRTGVTVE